MLDRESTFADAEVVELLKTKFVPAAIDQWYTRNQDDAEGRFYQSIAKQGPRNNMNSTTQGFYVCDAAGNLLAFNNNRHIRPIKKILKDVKLESEEQDVATIEKGKADPRYARELPEGATVIRVNTKVLGGYDDPKNEYEAIFQRAISRDNLWVLEHEKKQLMNGTFPKSLAERIARFHLVDNTRGEPKMWTKQAVKTLGIDMDTDGKVTGTVRLHSEQNATGYDAVVLGFIQFNQDKTAIDRFDLIAKGMYFGEGPYTRKAPKGKFPMAVAFRMADGSDVADAVAPLGTKGWLKQYTENR